MPATTDVLGNATQAVENFSKNGVPYYFKYDDPSLKNLAIVLVVIVLLVVVASGYFKAKSKNA